MSGVIEAPFTDEQVKSIDAFQKNKYMPKFTCGNDSCNHVALTVTKDGFSCPQCYNWSQNWCHDFMADWSWRMFAMPIEVIPEFSTLWNLTLEEIRVLKDAYKIRLREHRKYEETE